MGFKQWILPQLNKELANTLAEECGIEPFTALIATQRGYDDPFELEVFLDDEVLETEPLDLPDMQKAAATIGEFVAKGKKITVFGDYDCDGVTATVLLYRYLKSVGAQVDYYIPNRLLEGYGITESAIEQLHQNKTELIITVDNGIAANGPVARAAELGLTVVITDHHRQQGSLPQAAAVVDPHREDCHLPFKDFAGVGVAFLLVCALSGNDPAFLAEEYGELVALGTVADVMPLLRDNRNLVKLGLAKLNREPSPCFAALAAVAGVNPGELTAGKIAFSLAPRVNAAGRLANAGLAAKLLLAENLQQARPLAEQLDELNRERHSLEQEITKKAAEIAEQKRLYQNRVMVVSGPNWHEGVLGIAAARLAEHYGRPVILLSENSETGIAKGSARSVGSFSIFKAIESGKENLLTFGGHAQAAGLSLHITNIPAFRQTVNEYALAQPLCLPQLRVDCKLNPAAISTDLLLALEPLEPFGVGNPTPLFGLFGMRLDRITEIGDGKHLRLLLSKGNTMVAAVLFGTGAAEFAFTVGSVLDVLAILRKNTYKGETKISVQLQDIRPAGLNEEQRLLELELYDRFANAALREKDAESLLFTRQDMALVYRGVRGGLNSTEKLRANLPALSWAKIAVILEVLQELNLIAPAKQNGKLFFKLIEGSKTNLENSKIYCGLRSFIAEQ